jgi:alanyl-tRNA synthetase
MSTRRLYYTDSLLREFDATVTAISARADGRTDVILDETAFYPTSGGQPFDTGTIDGARIVDVIDREEDHEVVHVVDGAPTVGRRVHGVVDWARRLDHMQQHTGQHVLSAAFDRLHHARTTSFHLGAETATIDLAREVTPAEIVAAERAANDVVWADREVRVTFATEDEARALPLRKESLRTGTLRLIEVSDFDLSACGGTHVPRTGAIGIIAVAGWERFKGASRITFVCGGRALGMFGHLRDVVAAAGRLVSGPSAELPGAIERLLNDARASGRSERRLQDELAVYRAAEFRAQAETLGGGRGVLRAAPGADGAALKVLAAAIVAEPGHLAVLVGEGQPVPVIAARSADVGFDAAAWLKLAVARFGGRGGGRPEMAQGGLTASADDVLAFARESMSQ